MPLSCWGDALLVPPHGLVAAGVFRILEAFFAAHSTGEGKWVPSRDFYRQVRCPWSIVEATDRGSRYKQVVPSLPAHPYAKGIA